MVAVYTVKVLVRGRPVLLRNEGEVTTSLRLYTPGTEIINVKLEDILYWRYAPDFQFAETYLVRLGLLIKESPEELDAIQHTALAWLATQSRFDVRKFIVSHRHRSVREVELQGDGVWKQKEEETR